MKNFVFALVSLFVFSSAINAQSLQSTNDLIIIETGDVEILKEFKATKEQKKVIKKIKRYVSPRLLSDNPYAEALEGKTAKIQVNFDAQGNVSNVTVIESDVDGLDARFEKLVKEYNSKNPVTNAGVEGPTAIQLDIPLVAKKYTL